MLQAALRGGNTALPGALVIYEARTQIRLYTTLSAVYMSFSSLFSRIFENLYFLRILFSVRSKQGLLRLFVTVCAQTSCKKNLCMPQ